MKKILLSAIILLIASGCSRTLTSLNYDRNSKDKGVYYNLPKSIVKVDIQYTIYRDYDLVNGNKKYSGNSYAKIENPITITSLPTPDINQRYILTYKKNNSNYFFEDNYTIELSQNGHLKSLNWETENVAPDIAANIISSGLNLFKTLSPADDETDKEKYEDLISKYENVLNEMDSKILIETSKGNLKKVKEQNELQKLAISRLETLKKNNKSGQKDNVVKTETVFIDLEKDYLNSTFIKKTTSKTKNLYEIDLSSKFKGIDEENFPTLSFELPINTISTNSSEGLKYRIPTKVNYTLTLIDSTDIDHPQRKLIDDNLTLLQYGEINALPLNVKSRKKSKIAVTIDENTGLLTKVSNTSNSIIKESSSLLKSSTKEVYKTLDNYSFNKLKSALENGKTLLELNNSIEELNKEEKVNSKIQKEIEALKLLLEKLELEQKIKDLEN